jgi:hypothetical protein
MTVTVVAALERYRLVRGAGGIGTRQAQFGHLASTKSTAADQARSENRDVVDAFAPDQAVVPVIMPEILVAAVILHCVRPQTRSRTALEGY